MSEQDAGGAPLERGVRPLADSERAALAIDQALHEAVAAIYFDDSSDYARALRRIVRILGGPECAELLEANPRAAYEASAA